jgi:Domain of unknown function (DUF4288)
MAKGSTPSVTGLDEFGLSRSQLRSLGVRCVAAEVLLRLPPHFYPSPKLFRQLLPLTPVARRESIRRWRKEQLAQLTREERLPVHTVLRRGRDPIGISVNVTARALHRLLRSKYVGHVTIKSIQGKRPRVIARALDEATRLYSVRVLFALQWEQQRHGLQLVEDRIVLMRAKSEAEVRRRADRQFTREGYPVLNADGHFYRWGYQGIVDVCESSDREWSPKGTEAYYEVRNRRMKRRYEWRPKLAV